MSEDQLFVNIPIEDVPVSDVRSLFTPEELEFKVIREGLQDVERLPNLLNSLHAHVKHLAQEHVASGYNKWLIAGVLSRVAKDPRTYAGASGKRVLKLKTTGGAFYARLVMRMWVEFEGMFNLRPMGPRKIEVICPQCDNVFTVVLTKAMLDVAEIRHGIDSNTSAESIHYEN